MDRHRPDRARPGKEAIYVVWSDFARDRRVIRLRFTKLSTGRNPEVLIPPTTINPGTAQGVFPVVDGDGNLYVFYERFGEPTPMAITMV